MPKVSVVIPVYNAELYLSECLESVTTQTLKDIEIVCVADGPTDGSAKILDEYARRDGRITVISQENQGPGAARNSGIAVASGDYLCFVDSDDRLESVALEELYERACADELDVLYYGAAPFCDDSSLESQHATFTSYYRRNSEYPGVRSGKALLADMSDNNDYKPAVCFQLVRTDYYRANGLSFFEGILHEDNLFTFFCALRANRAGYVPKTYYQRRVRKNSIMTVAKGVANFRGFLVSYLEMLRFLVREDLDERTSGAAASLCAEMYQQALRVYSGLPKHERDTVALIDSSPESLVTCSLLTRQGNQLLKTKRLQKSLEATTKELEKLRSSRTFRLARYLRRVTRFGK